jgi:alpha-glucosidase
MNIKRIIIAGLAVAGFAGASTGAPVKLRSPNGAVSAVVDVGEKGQLQYSVSLEGKPVFVDSPLGLVLGGKKLGAAASIVKTSEESHKSSYKTRGCHAEALDHYKGAKISVHDARADMDFVVEFRVFDDAVAYRYVVPYPGREYSIDGELSAWKFADDCPVWSAAKNYEGNIGMKRLAEMGWNETLMPPVTAVLPDGRGYACILEANLVNYAGMVLRHPEKTMLGVSLNGKVKVTGDQETPWRLAVLAKDLTGLVNTDAVTNLCPPPPKELANADWIKPGRSVWSWWSSDTVGPQRQKEYADMAAQLGFEYNLIDWRWDKWKNPWKTIADIVAYSKKKGVNVWIWRHCKTLRDPKARKEFMDKAAEAGVVGLKIDFFPPENQATMAYYEELRRDAAEHKLMVNFHGANKPTGRSRTWPNEMTREGIRGHEWWMKGRFKMEPQHECALPFTRYVAGHGDYTPTSFDPERLKGRSWAFELAQAIVFTSPVMHYAGDPKFLLANPSVDVLKEIPSVWDETIVLPGSKIGEIAGFARRKGDSWFVGVMNSDKPRSLKIDFGFLGAGGYRAVLLKDSEEKGAAFVREEKDVTKNDGLEVKMRPMGGFVAMFTRRK